MYIYNIENIGEDRQKIIFVARNIKEVESFKSVDIESVCLNPNFKKKVTPQENGKIKQRIRDTFIGRKVVFLKGLTENEKANISFLKLSIKPLALKFKDIETTRYLDFLRDDQSKLYKECQMIEWIDKPYVGVNSKGVTVINQDLLCKFIMKHYSLILIGEPTSEKARIYLYSDGVYTEIGQQGVKNIISNLIPVGILTNRLLKDTAELLEGINKINKPETLDGKEGYINFINGILNLETGELLDHSPNYITTSQIPIEWTETPEINEEWEEYIKRSTGNNKDIIKLLYEVIGVVISNYNCGLTKKSITLLGGHNTGKSTFLNILIGIIGKRNTESLAFSNLAERFYLSNIMGKRLLCDYEGGDKLEKASLLLYKSLVSGEYVPVERKGFDRVDYQNKALLFRCANYLEPLNGGQGEDIFNREIIIPFDVVVKEKKPYLAESILKNTQYIIYKSVQAFKELKKCNFNFTIPTVSQRLKFEYMIDSDSVRTFIAEKYDITGNTENKIYKKDLEEEYNNFCYEEGLNPCKPKEFKRRLISHYNVPCKKAKIKVNEKSFTIKRCYIGLRNKLIETNEATPFDDKKAK